MKKMLFIAAVLAVTLWGCQRPNADQMMGHVVSRLEWSLGLDAAQKQKLGDLVQTVRQIIAQHKKEETGTRDEIGALLTAPTLDQAKLRALIDGRFASWSDSRSQDIDTVMPKLAAFLDSLRPDQKKKLQDLWSQWKSRIGGPA